MIYRHYSDQMSCSLATFSDRVSAGQSPSLVSLCRESLSSCTHLPSRPRYTISRRYAAQSLRKRESKRPALEQISPSSSASIPPTPPSLPHHIRRPLAVDARRAISRWRRIRTDRLASPLRACAWCMYIRVVTARDAAILQHWAQCQIAAQKQEGLAAWASSVVPHVRENAEQPACAATRSAQCARLNK